MQQSNIDLVLNFAEVASGKPLADWHRKALTVLLRDHHTRPAEAPQTTESPTGQPVAHLDAEEAADVVSFVWLFGPECSAQQKLFAIGTDETTGKKRFAIPVDQCTPEQLAGAKVETLP